MNGLRHEYASVLQKNETGANEDLVLELGHGRIWHFGGQAVLQRIFADVSTALASISRTSDAVCTARDADIATVGFRHFSANDKNGANASTECLRDSSSHEAERGVSTGVRNLSSPDASGDKID